MLVLCLEGSVAFEPVWSYDLKVTFYTVDGLRTTLDQLKRDTSSQRRIAIEGIEIHIVPNPSFSRFVQGTINWLRTQLRFALPPQIKSTSPPYFVFDIQDRFPWARKEASEYFDAERIVQLRAVRQRTGAQAAGARPRPLAAAAAEQLVWQDRKKTYRG